MRRAIQVVETAHSWDEAYEMLRGLATQDGYLGGRVLPPGPGTKLSTFGGNPASCRISTSSDAITGDALAGLRHTVFPVTSAAEVIPVQIANGKFHGEMQAKTPRPWTAT